MIDLQDAVVVITGTSSGLGRRFAIDLAAAGAIVTGLARREQLLASVAEEMRRTSPASATMVCDVSDTDRYAAVLAGIERERGRIDVLINNAGIGEPPAVPDRQRRSAAYSRLHRNLVQACSGMVSSPRGTLRAHCPCLVHAYATLCSGSRIWAELELSPLLVRCGACASVTGVRLEGGPRADEQPRTVPKRVAARTGRERSRKHSH